MQRVVDVPAPWRVHAAHAQVAHVAALRVGVLCWVKDPRQGGHAVVHRWGEGCGVDVVLYQDHLLQAEGGRVWGEGFREDI